MSAKRIILMAGLAAVAIMICAAGLLWTFNFCEEAVSTPAPSPTEPPAGTPAQGSIIERPDFLSTQYTPVLIAEVLEATGEQMTL